MSLSLFHAWDLNILEYWRECFFLLLAYQYLSILFIFIRFWPFDHEVVVQKNILNPSSTSLHLSFWQSEWCFQLIFLSSQRCLGSHWEFSKVRGVCYRSEDMHQPHFVRLQMLHYWHPNFGHILNSSSSNHFISQPKLHLKLLP